MIRLRYIVDCYTKKQLKNIYIYIIININILFKHSTKIKFNKISNFANKKPIIISII